MTRDDGFPCVRLPAFEPLPPGPDVTLAKPAAVLQGELDAAYRVINALVRKFAGGSAFLEAGLTDRELPVVTVEHKQTADGFTITVRPL